MKISVSQDVITMSKEDIFGQRYDNGACTGQDFSYRNVSYRSSVMTTHFRVQVEELKGKAISSDMISVDGKLLKIKSKHCITDALSGTYYLTSQIPRERCDRLKSIYTGPASVFVPSQENKELEEILYFEDNNTSRSGGLTLQGEVELCKRGGRKTNIPAINMLFLHHSKDRPLDTTIGTNEISGRDILSDGSELLARISATFLKSTLELSNLAGEVEWQAMQYQERYCKLLITKY